MTIPVKSFLFAVTILPFEPKTTTAVQDIGAAPIIENFKNLMKPKMDARIYSFTFIEF